MQLPVPHHRHTITNGQRLARVVGHDQPRGSTNLQNRTEFTAQPQPHLHIQIGEGLIEQHKLGGWCQSAGQGKALLLAARELMGITQLQPLQTQQLQQPGCTAVVLARSQTEASVLPRREMGEQCVVLKDHADPAPLRWQPMAVPRHGALLQVHRTLRGALKACDQSQQGGFPAAGGPQQPHQLTRCELQVNPPQRPGSSGAVVAMPEVTHGNGGLGLRQQRNAMIDSILRSGHDRSSRNNPSSTRSGGALQPGGAGRWLAVLLGPDPAGSGDGGHGGRWRCGA